MFRVLFVTTSSKRRALNILRFGAGMSENYSAQSIYAVHMPDLMNVVNSVTAPLFLNHRLEPVRLVREPRFCRLAPLELKRDRIMAELSQKNFVSSACCKPPVRNQTNKKSETFISSHSLEN